MTVEELLQRLEGVRPRGRGKWSARCPAHKDKSPSLSIAEGADGRILLHDFAGCLSSEIVAALGLRVTDLFNDGPRFPCQRPTPKPAKVDRCNIALRFDIHGVLLTERAEAVLRVACGMDTTTWSGHDFDAAMNAVGQAHNDRVHAQVLFDVADDLRLKDYEETHR